MSERFYFQRDYIFTIVRANSDWNPKMIYDIPPAGEIVSQTPVASFEEAHDDLLRCNNLALEQDLNEWAVIQTSRAEKY